MIFESVKHITNKKEFVELVLIYIRMVEVIANSNNKSINNISDLSDSAYIELKDMGMIESSDDITILKKILGTRYASLVSSITFYIENKSLFGNLLHKLSNKHRKELQEKTKNTIAPKFVDFFAGAGGLSCGFSQAGFKVCFANDNEDVCVETYRYNHPELPANKVVKGDIRNIVNNICDYIDEDIDIVVGGPPCQGFSSANQQRIIDDPRNELYKYYIEAIKHIAPKFILMENVRGMLSVANQVVEDYKAIKISKNGHQYAYDIAYRLLNSMDFGVAQSRERLIYIAVRNDVAFSKQITAENIFEDINKVTIYDITPNSATAKPMATTMP